MAAANGRTSARKVTTLLAVIAVAAVIASMALASVTVLAPAPSRAGAAVQLKGAEASIDAAEFSLAHGGGPALGATLSCESAGAGAARCATPGLLPATDPVDGYTWTNLTARLTNSPSARITTLAWDGTDGYVLLYGGIASGGVNEQDTWTYANGTWTNITATTTGAPPTLVFGSMAWDPTSGDVVLFGGENEQTIAFVNYTWVYHDKTWTNLTSTIHTAPFPRVWFQMTTDSAAKDVVLYGGYTGTWQKDTWTYKNGTWTNVTSSQIIALPTVYYAVLSDYPGYGAFMTGGFFDNSLLVSATYVFLNGQWTNLTSTFAVSPPPPFFGFAAFLPSLSGVLEFTSAIIDPTGTGVAFVPVAWLFSGGTWQNVTNLLGAVEDDYGAAYGSAAYVPADQSIITFGGLLSGLSSYSKATWALSAPPTVVATASKKVVDAGQSVSFTGTVSGGLDPNAANWSFGDGGSSLSLSPSHVYATAGLYTATVKVTSLVGTNASASVSVQVNPAPAVSLSATPNATAGTSVGLVASVVGGTGPYTYAWTLGDGSTATGLFVNHVYASGGAYAVNVTVTDAVGGVAKASLSLTVAAAPSPSSSVSLTSGTGLYLLVGIIVLLVVAVLLGVMLLRKPKSPSGAPTPYSGPMTPAPPPPGPPPGAS